MEMHPWNKGRLLRPKSGAKLSEIFDECFRERLGPNADSAAAICKKFCDHGMLDQFELLEKAIDSGKVAECVKELEGIFDREIIANQIPHLDKMTESHQTILANNFLIADLQIMR